MVGAKLYTHDTVWQWRSNGIESMASCKTDVVHMQHYVEEFPKSRTTSNTCQTDYAGIISSIILVRIMLA